jgi:3-phosphoshikimate 1-carboxyvinyltransferase
LGIDIEEKGDELVVHGKGIHGLREPHTVIDCGNSGTTLRLLSGIVSGNPFFSVLTGDDSLRTRPMQRVIAPLRQMGAEILGRDGDKYPPLAIRGKKLRAIRYVLPVASAQVKSAILLAGLYSDGETGVAEPFQSRDHTERMLPFFGARMKVEGLTVTIHGGDELYGRDTIVPGDFSSAAFFIVAALLAKGSEMTVRAVGINPTRTGLLTVLRRMGAEIAIENIREVSGETVADISCKGGKGLRAVDITREEMPLLIDEFPILCVAASQAEGLTSIRGAEELRVKESDRIKAMTTELRKMGVEIEEYPDGVSIKGTAMLKGGKVESYGDHRIAMSLAVAGVIAEGSTEIHNGSCVNISFPRFFDEVKRLSGHG